MNRFNRQLSVLLFASFALVACSTTDTVTDTELTTAGATTKAPAGTFVGSQQQGVTVFRGIPYALPPVGENRWLAPQPAPAVSGTQDATAFGAVCPQPSDNPMVAGFPQSEDCLTLNIWSPTGATQTERDALPVMVWIHGGSFKVGSGRWLKTEASHLASQGAVVVTINYRLGNLGRFAHPALSEQQSGQPLANYGLMDQVMALEWVQKNINAFGGDPNNVTIFGYSAGAVSVNFLMAAPSAKGLFHHAIAQSSAVLLPVSRHISQTQANHPPLEQDGLQLAEHFNIANDGNAPERLRLLSAEQIITVPTQAGSMNPVVDGVFIAEDLGKTFNEGNFHRVDYIAGVNSWEASLAKSLENIPADFLFGLLIKTYNLSGQEQAMHQAYGKKTPLMDINKMIFADSFHASTYHLAQQVAKHGGNSYLYWFAYQPEGAAKTLPGVPHGSEVPYIFGSLDQRDRVGSPPVTDKDRKVSQQVQQYWLNFAATGNPNDAKLVNWPKLSKQQSNWLVIDDTITTSPDLLQSRMELWQKAYQ